MREVTVVGIQVQMPDRQPIVLLHDVEGAEYLPIWVGAPEASAIAVAHQGVTPPRPLTHDLLINVLDACGRTLREVRVVAMVENVFHAELVLDDDTVVSSRASDAIAVALRASVKIFVDPHVMTQGAVPAPAEDEAQVEAFREMLDSASVEDFMGDSDDSGQQ